MDFPTNSPRLLATCLSARLRRFARLGAVALVALGIGSAMAQLAPAAAGKAAAAIEPAVAVQLTQHKVFTGADGKESLVDGATVKPGEVLEYRATYINKSNTAVKGVVATLPIPEGLEYRPGSARPGANLVQAATKDGVFGAEPLSRKVNGKVEPVPYSDYRTLRWNLGSLPARGEAAVSARAAVQVYVPTAAASAQASGAAPQAPPVSVQKVVKP